MSDHTLYDRDFYAWANEQAGLLRAGKMSEADVEHIAEEIESMGRSEKRELVSRLTILLLHLLKWQFLPVRQGPSWRLSIATTRDTLADHLDENPSLRIMLESSMGVAYRRARRNAAVETGLAEATFPATCAWSAEQILSENFWPDAG